MHAKQNKEKRGTPDKWQIQNETNNMTKKGTYTHIYIHTHTNKNSQKGRKYKRVPQQGKETKNNIKQIKIKLKHKPDSKMKRECQVVNN